MQCSEDHLSKLDDEVQVTKGEACGLVRRQVVHWLAQLVWALAGVVCSALVDNGNCIHVQQEERPLSCCAFAASTACRTAPAFGKWIAEMAACIQQAVQLPAQRLSEV